MENVCGIVLQIILLFVNLQLSCSRIAFIEKVVVQQNIGRDYNLLAPTEVEWAHENPKTLENHDFKQPNNFVWLETSTLAGAARVKRQVGDTEADGENIEAQEAPKEEDASEELPVEGAPKEEDPPEELPEEDAPKKEDTSEVLPEEDAPKEEDTPEELPEEDAPKELPEEDAPKEEDTREELPEEDAPKELPEEDAPKEEDTPEELPEKDAPKEEDTREELPEEDALKKEDTPEELPEDAAPKEEDTPEVLPKEDTPEELPKEDAPEKLPKDDAAEGATNEKVNAEDMPKKETATDDIPKEEGSSEDVPKEDPPGNVPKEETPDDVSETANPKKEIVEDTALDTTADASEDKSQDTVKEVKEDGNKGTPIDDLKVTPDDKLQNPPQVHHENPPITSDKEINGNPKEDSVPEHPEEELLSTPNSEDKAKELPVEPDTKVKESDAPQETDSIKPTVDKKAEDTTGKEKVTVKEEQDAATDVKIEESETKIQDKVDDKIKSDDQDYADYVIEESPAPDTSVSESDMAEFDLTVGEDSDPIQTDKDHSTTDDTDDTFAQIPPPGITTDPTIRPGGEYTVKQHDMFTTTGPKIKPHCPPPYILYEPPPIQFRRQTPEQYYPQNPLLKYMDRPHPKYPNLSPVILHSAQGEVMPGIVSRNEYIVCVLPIDEDSQPTISRSRNQQYEPSYGIDFRQKSIPGMQHPQEQGRHHLRQPLQGYTNKPLYFTKREPIDKFRLYSLAGRRN